MSNSPITHYVVRYYEPMGNGDVGFEEVKIAKTMDDVAAWLSDVGGGADGRTFHVDIREREVIQ